MTSRHRLRSLGTLTWLNGVLPIRSQPLYLINLVGQPLSFLFFITIASAGKLYPYAIGGGMLMTILSIGTSLQTDISHYKTDLKLQDVMIASPVEEWVYVGGLALSELVYSLPGMGLFVLLWIVGGWATPFAAITLAGVLLLVWAFASALGFTLATYFQDVRETFVFSSVISLSLSVIPPVYYPISALPAWLRPYAWLSPTTYAADLIHGTVGVPGPSFLAAATDWGVLIGFTVALLALASFKARWREP
jgi:ABC-2 type transport system permease protein